MNININNPQTKTDWFMLLLPAVLFGGLFYALLQASDYYDKVIQLEKQIEQMEMHLLQCL